MHDYLFGPKNVQHQNWQKAKQFLHCPDLKLKLCIPCKCNLFVLKNTSIKFTGTKCKVLLSNTDSDTDSDSVNIGLVSKKYLQ